jgi:hypothetical protein
LPYKDLCDICRLGCDEVMGTSKRLDFVPDGSLMIVVGNYGSGKTEVAVNLALFIAHTGRKVQLADLDIVNLYFRCREARTLLEAAGIRVVVPAGAQASADLPIVLPEIKGMLRPKGDQISIFDVGGDPVGARILSSYNDILRDEPYALWQVINSRRPNTDTVAGCLAMKTGIEAASRLKITGLIVNSHLISETTPEVILEGYRLAKEVSAKSGLPIKFVTAIGLLYDDPELDEIDVPLLRLNRYLLPPWLDSKSRAAACAG